MTLRRRLIVHIALTAAGATALAAAVGVGVHGLREDFGVAVQANTRLRHVYEVGLHVAAAKRWLREDPPNVGRAAEELQVAALMLDRRSGDGPGDGDPWPDAAMDDASAELGGAGTASAARVRVLLYDAIAQVGQLRGGGEDGGGNGGGSVAIHPGEAPALDEALATIADLSARTRTVITDRQRAADAKHRMTQTAVVALFAVVVAGVLVAGVRLYRAVTGPVGRLGETARRIAAGRRDERAAPAGDAEFVALAGDFNRMAAELDGLCNDLERQVAAKSKELVRSERLASVGFLAAGVAHEINNPLGIIAGYGERALQHLRRGPADAATVERVGRSIEVMCDEAFRCKEITQRLLSLARGGTAGETPKPVCLAAIAREVAGTVGALGDFGDRTVTVNADETAGRPGAYTVAGSDAELKQVVLNLVINALQAVGPVTGRVAVTLRRANDAFVELDVADDGRGMTPETLNRVFEPFFSDRREAARGGSSAGGGGGERGTGLGLSITHAIVADHGGSIRAESDGPGRGSRFVVRLPAATTSTSLAAAAAVTSAPGAGEGVNVVRA